MSITGTGLNRRKHRAHLVPTISDHVEAFRYDLTVLQTGRYPIAELTRLQRAAGLAEVNQRRNLIAPRRVSFAPLRARRLARTI